MAQNFEIGHPGGEAIDADNLHYTVGDVQLLMHPEEGMIWWDWYYALIDIKTFVKRKPFFYGWSLMIMDREENQVVGRAWMSDVSQSIKHQKTTADVG